MLNRLVAVFLAVDTGPPEEVIPHLECCRNILARGEDWRGLAGSVALAQAVGATADGRFDEAKTHFAKALEIFTRYALPWAQAETLPSWGRAMRGIGDRAEAPGAV